MKRHRHRGLARLPALLAFCLCALAACGGEAEPGSSRGRVAELELRALGPLPAEHQVRVLRSIEIPSDPREWNAEQGEFVLAPPVLGADPSLILRGSGRKVISIPGPFDAREFSRVGISLRTARSAGVSLHLATGEQRALHSRSLKLAPSPDSQRILLEFPPPPPGEDVYERLAIAVRSDGEPILDGPIELISFPLAATLPAPESGPGMIALGGELRRGIALTPGRALEAQIEVGPRSSLRFSYGVPAAASQTHEQGRLVLRIEREDGGATETRALPLALRRQDRWHEELVDLEDFRGGRARVRFELEGPIAPGELAVLAEALVAHSGSQPPTVLLVTSDTHRADHLGLHPGGKVRTPTLDALAARGIHFEDCYSSTNVTNPSHIALMTARSPRDHGIVDNFVVLASGAPTLAERFLEAGFVTYASLSAGHLGDAGSGLGQGFLRMAHPAVQQSAEPTIATLERWLPSADGLPLFVWLHLFDAHGPYEPPEPFASRYYPKGKNPFDPELPAPELPPQIFLPALEGLRDLEYPPAMYRGEVDYLDEQLGRLLARKRFGSAIVAFTADHGESFGEHGIWYAHEGLYPQTIHVPLILAWPGAPAGTRVAEPVSQLDLGRTLLDLAGFPELPFPGQSLVARAEGAPRDLGPRFALSAFAREASITSDGWHLLLHLRAASNQTGLRPGPKHSHELYHLAVDPACEQDLAEREPEIAARLRRELMHWLGQRERLEWTGSTSQDEEFLGQLAQLGYTADDRADTDEQAKRLIDPDCACEWCVRSR